MRDRQRDQSYCSHGVMSVYLIQVVSEGQTEGPEAVSVSLTQANSDRALQTVLTSVGGRSVLSPFSVCSALSLVLFGVFCYFVTLLSFVSPWGRSEGWKRARTGGGCT